MTLRDIERVEAEQIATDCIYKLRQHVATRPLEYKIAAAKILLGKVRTMVEDLEQALNP